jgi:hypothetical protein
MCLWTMSMASYILGKPNNSLNPSMMLNNAHNIDVQTVQVEDEWHLYLFHTNLWKINFMGLLLPNCDPWICDDDLVFIVSTFILNPKVLCTTFVCKQYE